MNCKKITPKKLIFIHKSLERHVQELCFPVFMEMPFSVVHFILRSAVEFRFEILTGTFLSFNQSSNLEHIFEPERDLFRLVFSLALKSFHSVLSRIKKPIMFSFEYD